MTFRTYILAGLITASSIPAAYAATPNTGIGVAQQSAEEGRGDGAGQDPGSASIFSRKHKEAMDRGATHEDASAEAARSVAAGPAVTPEASREWSRRHLAAMAKGASHLDASIAAGRE